MISEPVPAPAAPITQPRIAEPSPFPTLKPKLEAEFISPSVR